MLLPNAGYAVIPASKLRRYALDETHTRGRSKARGFSALGYTVTEWQVLETDIRRQHLNKDAIEVEPNAFGRKWCIDAEIRGPNGRSRMVRSVWIVQFDQDRPILVSIYPT